MKRAKVAKASKAKTGKDSKSKKTTSARKPAKTNTITKEFILDKIKQSPVMAKVTRANIQKLVAALAGGVGLISVGTLAYIRQKCKEIIKIFASGDGKNYEEARKKIKELLNKFPTMHSQIAEHLYRNSEDDKLKILIKETIKNG